MGIMTQNNNDVVIRPLTDEDSLEELTDLLHRAYATLADMGLRYMATHQSVDITRSRLEKGLGIVVIQDEKIIATLTYYSPAQSKGTPFLDLSEVAHIGQLAVDPSLRNQGIGNALMAWAKKKALADGALELALDTADTADHLISWYERLGYRIVEQASWDCTNYDSVIMSLKLKSSG